MSENLRDEIAEAILANFNPPDDKHASWWINPHLSADAVLAVVGPEMDRLRAEVERWKRAWQGADREWAVDQRRAESAEARLARVEALCDDLERKPYGEQLTSPSVIRAALASVPEPSDTEPVGKRLDARWLSFPGKHPVCRDCGADWSPVRRGECIACGSDSGPLPSDSELAATPRGETPMQEIWRSTVAAAEPHRTLLTKPAPDADREAGER